VACSALRASPIGFEHFVRDACLQLLGSVTAQEMPQDQPKDICYRWQVGINSSESSLETESVGLTELGSEDSFSGAEKRISLLTLTAEQQIPP
jgi:hypothetical protein